jgi:hypothetical protein
MTFASTLCELFLASSLVLAGTADSVQAQSAPRYKAVAFDYFVISFGAR